MSALPNFLSSAGLFSQYSSPVQEYLDKTFTETTHSHNTEITQNSIYFTIKSSTSSIRDHVANEDEFSSYECSRFSGSLSFWDNPEEDIYTLEDGQPL
jgi:hypothetical protein